MFPIKSGPTINPPRIQQLDGLPTRASVLRLDEVHPVVSGNKWYKLHGFLQRAQAAGKKGLITFGGAYSNHIVATASACRALGLRSIGLIRGEQASQLSPTLQDALGYGMELHFLSRSSYKDKAVPEALTTLVNPDEYLLVPEGGYGIEGLEGIAGLAKTHNLSSYSHILCAVGTGTTLAGLTVSAGPGQQVIGISVLKNNTALEEAVSQLLPEPKRTEFRILHQFHFGGYAKQKPELLAFMNQWYQLTGIPSDFVYTGKLFRAYQQLASERFFGPGAHVLLVHTGGLQGNRSLPAGTLIF